MNSPPDDRLFSQTLQQHWRVAPQRTPDFRTAVWARIETARRSPATWGAWLRHHVLGFTTFAAASIAVAVTVGGWAAREETDRTREQLVQRYLASIDPHQRVDTESR